MLPCILQEPLLSPHLANLNRPKLFNNAFLPSYLSPLYYAREITWPRFRETLIRSFEAYSIVEAPTDQALALEDTSRLWSVTQRLEAFNRPPTALGRFALAGSIPELIQLAEGSDTFVPGGLLAIILAIQNVFLNILPTSLGSKETDLIPTGASLPTKETFALGFARLNFSEEDLFLVQNRLSESFTADLNADLALAHGRPLLLFLPRSLLEDIGVPVPILPSLSFRDIGYAAPRPALSNLERPATHPFPIDLRRNKSTPFEFEDFRLAPLALAAEIVRDRRWDPKAAMRNHALVFHAGRVRNKSPTKPLFPTTALVLSAGPGIGGSLPYTFLQLLVENVCRLTFRYHSLFGDFVEIEPHQMAERFAQALQLSGFAWEEVERFFSQTRLAPTFFSDMGRAFSHVTSSFLPHGDSYIDIVKGQLPLRDYTLGPQCHSEGIASLDFDFSSLDLELEPPPPKDLLFCGGQASDDSFAQFLALASVAPGSLAPFDVGLKVPRDDALRIIGVWRDPRKRGPPDELPPSGPSSPSKFARFGLSSTPFSASRFAAAPPALREPFQRRDARAASVPAAHGSATSQSHKAATRASSLPREPRLLSTEQAPTESPPPACKDKGKRRASPECSLSSPPATDSTDLSLLSPFTTDTQEEAPTKDPFFSLPTIVEETFTDDFGNLHFDFAGHSEAQSDSQGLQVDGPSRTEDPGSLVPESESGTQEPPRSSVSPPSSPALSVVTDTNKSVSHQGSPQVEGPDPAPAEIGRPPSETSAHEAEETPHTPTGRGSPVADPTEDDHLASISQTSPSHVVNKSVGGATIKYHRMRAGFECNGCAGGTARALLESDWNEDQPLPLSSCSLVVAPTKLQSCDSGPPKQNRTPRKTSGSSPRRAGAKHSKCSGCVNVVWENPDAASLAAATIVLLDGSVSTQSLDRLICQHLVFLAVALGNPHWPHLWPFLASFSPSYWGNVPALQTGESGTEFFVAQALKGALGINWSDTYCNTTVPGPSGESHFAHNPVSNFGQVFSPRLDGFSEEKMTDHQSPPLLVGTPGMAFPGQTVWTAPSEGAALQLGTVRPGYVLLSAPFGCAECAAKGQFCVRFLEDLLNPSSSVPSCRGCTGVQASHCSTGSDRGQAYARCRALSRQVFFLALHFALHPRLEEKDRAILSGWCSFLRDFFSGRPESHLEDSVNGFTLRLPAIPDSAHSDWKAEYQDWSKAPWLQAGHLDGYPVPGFLSSQEWLAWKSRSGTTRAKTFFEAGETLKPKTKKSQSNKAVSFTDRDPPTPYPATEPVRPSLPPRTPGSTPAPSGRTAPSASPIATERSEPLSVADLGVTPTPQSSPGRRQSSRLSTRSSSSMPF